MTIGLRPALGHEYWEEQIHRLSHQHHLHDRHGVLDVDQLRHHLGGWLGTDQYRYAGAEVHLDDRAGDRPRLRLHLPALAAGIHRRWAQTLGLARYMVHEQLRPVTETMELAVTTEATGATETTETTEATASGTTVLLPGDPAVDHIEAEARVLAMVLLMPAEHVARLWETSGGDPHRLARHFDVNVHHVLRRVRDLGLR